MAKWKLMLASLPIALLTIVLKVVLIEAFDFQGWVELSDVALIVSAGVFLIGFMLAGTMSDYKESERIPGEIASALESMEETCINLAIKTNFSQKKILENCQSLAQQVNDWFLKKVKEEELFEALRNFNHLINDLDRVGASPPILTRVLNELSSLRRILTRSYVISKTGFLATGYALLEVLLIVIIGIMLIVKFKNLIATIIVVFFITFVYVYMYKLIKDIDDPFEYEADGKAGASEVALFPLHEYLDRVQKRILACNA